MQHPVDISFLIGLGLIEVPPLLCMAFPCIDADCVVICASASVEGRTQPLIFGGLDCCGVSYLQGCSLNVQDVKNRSYSATF